jgi:hypothetical protein
MGILFEKVAEVTCGLKDTSHYQILTIAKYIKTYII